MASMLNQSSDNALRGFHCLIEGENAVFGVQIAANEKIFYLKEAIYEQGKNRTLSNIDAKDLTLLKVTTTESPALTLTFLCFCRSI